MNDQPNHSIDDYSPDALMRVFSKSRLGLSILAALLAHVVVIGALTIPSLIAGAGEATDPDQDQAQSEAEQRDERIAEEAAQRGEGEADAEGDGETEGDGADGEQATGEDADNGEGEVNGNGEGEAGDNGGDDEQTPVEQRTSESADAEDIPDEPDLGITIDETNP